MIRGYIRFKCDDCGKKFFAPDIEYNATVYSCPQECPKCHSMHTMPAGLFSLFNHGFYKRIWSSIGKN